MKKRWRQEEDRVLIDLLGKATPYKEIAERLKRGISSCKHRAKALGVSSAYFALKEKAKKELIALYESGVSVKEISENHSDLHYHTIQMIIYRGTDFRHVPNWNEKETPENTKRSTNAAKIKKHRNKIKGE